MANFSMNPLAALAGVSQSYQNFQQNQADQQYTRQARMQMLQSASLSNQEKEIQIQQQRKVMQDQDLMHQAALAALNPPPDQNQSQSGAPAGMAALAQTAGGSPGAALNTGVQQGASTSGIKGPLTMDQLAQMDKDRSLPLGTAYGIMQAESAGQPGAVSKKGAVGLFQVEPSTAAQPGYGLKAFNPTDPNSAMDYFAAMYKKAGGDMNRALGYWNAGPNGNPDNPETKAFAPRVLQGAQQFQQQYQTAQQAQTPSPADKVAAAQASGVDVPLQGMNKAVQGQQQMIQQNMRTAQILMKQGRPDLAAFSFAAAQKLQDDGAALQSKQMDTQQKANTTVADIAAGVKDQDSYNGLISQLRQNPAMASVTRGLNLTGDYATDKNKIDTLAERAETLKDQQANQIAKQQLVLKQNADARAQQKADQPVIARATAQALDDKRQEAAANKGIPFVPSIAATGGDPVAIARAQLATQKANTALLSKLDSGSQGISQTMGYSQEILGMLNRKDQNGNPDPVATGGFFQRLPGVGYMLTGGSLDKQAFEKASNNLVSAMARADAAFGGAGRSTFTAAAFANYKTQKPNLDVGNKVNIDMATTLYDAAAMAQNRTNFMHEFAQANPQADLNTAVGMWNSYEQSLGSPRVYDPKTGAFVPNNKGVPVLPDGTPNDKAHGGDYVDYHDYFKANYHG